MSRLCEGYPRWISLQFATVQPVVGRLGRGFLLRRGRGHCPPTVSIEGHLALNSQVVPQSTPCVYSTLTVPPLESKEPMKMSLSVSSVLALPLSVIAQAPNPPPQAPPGLQPAADTFISWMKWGGLVGGVIGMIIC